MARGMIMMMMFTMFMMMMMMIQKDRGDKTLNPRPKAPKLQRHQICPDLGKPWHAAFIRVPQYQPPNFLSSDNLGII